MKPDKTYHLTIQPISKITEEQMQSDVLATDGKHWMNGLIFNQTKLIGCKNKYGEVIFNITHFAELPKTE